MNILRFALVGCGRISKRHCDVLTEGKIDGAKLVAVCDKNSAKAEEAGNKYSVPFFLDMHEMMMSQNIDVVVVLTESGNHARHVIELAKYRKDIIVEKPMALTVKDADAMIAACANAKVRLFVVKQNRFNLPVIKLREAIEAKRFGKLILGTIRVRWSRTQDYYDQDDWRGTWALDGGVLTNQASHHIDLLEWMMGGVDKVIGFSKNALADIEAEDTAIAIIQFKNGALGVIEASTAVRPKDLEGSISIMGELGTVEIGGFAVNEIKVWNFFNSTSDDAMVKNQFSVNPPNVYGFGHQSYYEHVVSCIANDQHHMVDGVEGRKSVELIHAIYNSIESGHAAIIDEKPRSLRLGQGKPD